MNNHKPCILYVCYIHLPLWYAFSFVTGVTLIVINIATMRDSSYSQQGKASGKALCFLHCLVTFQAIHHHLTYN